MSSPRFVPALFLSLPLALFAQSACAAGTGMSPEGRLEAMDAKGKALGACPLKHTGVSVQISGFIARVTVRQQFHNPFTEKIEAIYVFPLSHDSAVDRMTMKVGRRTIQGQIKERGEARAIYESARARGKVASLLDQERPNIFTQAVANIEPGAEVDITIAYSETLKWKDGEYEFSFPMTVEPRYMPGGPTGVPTTGWAPPTDEVHDAHKISPPVAPPGTRAGHDISITVQLNAGIPIRRLDSRQHAVDIEYPQGDKSRAVIRLQDKQTIPNKDFVLVYQTAGDEIADTLLTHTDARGKFFTLVLQPPKRVRTPQIVPKEIIFAIDKSGSMMGFPIETAKKAMRLCIEGAHAQDTFNLICFDGGTSFCFEKPVANTPENRRAALAFLEDLEGGGGTEMMTAVNACLAGQDDPRRVRIVCFMTDGCVGNDIAIIAAVKRNSRTARVFSFGIGTSVNRYLLDNIARAGRGEVHYILDARDTAGAAERFYERVRTPVLTDVTLDFGGLRVTELYPPRVPDLFASTPIVVKGQYKQGGKGTITLRGRTGEGPFQRKINVELPDEQPQNEVLAPLWARAKVEDLMNGDLAGIQQGMPNPAQKEAILGLGLRYQLLTQFTSFVAVEEKVTTEGGQPKTVSVPVELPEGVSHEGIFGAAGIGAGLGTGTSWGSGGSGAGFGARGSGQPMFVAGGTKRTERASTSSLIWLREHQQSDGRWRFDPPAASEKGYNNPGTWKADAGATALGLLPFLGAGQTHRTKGPYRAAVDNGLRWLISHQKPDGDLSAGGSPKMLSHALAAIALSEAYGLTADNSVGMAAQKAIQFIIACQDGKTGGWAEARGKPPALSVSAWQIMALQSAKLAGLKVPANILKKAERFLGSLEAEQGPKYGDTSLRDGNNATSAMGLLSRGYLGGWHGTSRVFGGKGGIFVDPSAKPEQPAAKSASEPADPFAQPGPAQPEATPAPRTAGQAFLLKTGPSADDAVYNLYATVYMHALSGYEWDEWNRKMRKQLVDSQIRDGGETGSWWNLADVHAADGGRLFQTAINMMILEVYYRYLPLYKVEASGNETRFYCTTGRYHNDCQ